MEFEARYERAKVLVWLKSTKTTMQTIAMIYGKSRQWVYDELAWYYKTDKYKNNANLKRMKDNLSHET